MFLEDQRTVNLPVHLARTSSISGVRVAHLNLFLSTYYFVYFMFFSVYVFPIWFLSLDYIVFLLESWFPLLLFRVNISMSLARKRLMQMKVSIFLYNLNR